MVSGQLLSLHPPASISPITPFCLCSVPVPSPYWMESPKDFPFTMIHVFSLVEGNGSAWQTGGEGVSLG